MMLLAGTFSKEGPSTRPKAHKGDKKKHSLANRGRILFCLSTSKLKGGEKKKGSSHVVLGTDLIRTKRAEGQLHLISLHSVRKRIFVPLPTATPCTLKHGRTYHPQPVSQCKRLVTIQASF